MMRLWPALALAAFVAAAAPAQALTITPVESDGGIKAWLVEDHSLKIVSVHFEFLAGTAHDPKGKEGLSELLPGLLDEGAGELDGATFHAKLEELTASFEAQAGLDTFTISSRVRTENLNATVDLLHLALTAPRFEPEAVARIKNDVEAEIAQAREDPEQLADMGWRRAALGDHPYGRPWLGTPATLDALKVEDLRGFMRQRFARDDVTIGVVGDISPETLKPLLDRLFAGLPAHAAPDAIPDTVLKTDGSVELMRLEVPQSAAMFGEAGIKRDDPDWYAATLVTHILGGGGFDARLTEEVRVKRGLAYSVDFYLDPLDHVAVLLGDVATRNEKVAESIAVIRDEFRRMRDDGPTKKELAAAKTYITGSFALDLDSTRRIAALLVTLQRDHLGLDYPNRRSGLFDAVTLDQAKRVAKRLFDPDKLLFVVVGGTQNLPGAKPAPAIE
jgi:zinc protease